MSSAPGLRRRPLVFALAMLALLVFVPAARAQNLPPTYRPGEVLIRFSPQATAADVQAIRSDLGATEIRSFPRIGVSHLKISTGVPEAIARYRGDARVAFIEPNYRVHADLVPNDTYFPQMWSLQNTGQSGGVPGADISAVQAWDVATGSSSILVGIVDTGYDYNHPDLAANVWTNPGEIPGNGIDDDGNGYIDDVHGWDFVNNDNDPMDDNGHGTHVSGTIGAVGNNSLGVVGVCWNVRIMALKFLDSGGYGDVSNAILAIQYATRMGARVLNNSWGGGGYSEALRLAIQDAGAAGIVFVAAAGNDAVDDDVYPHYPSSYDLPNIVAVASTDRYDGLSSFSCWGRTSVDLAAPGSEILSTLPGNSYGVYSGTSMATPHVTGALALLMGKVPTIDGTSAKARLLATVDTIPALRGRVLTGGRLNAFMLVADPDTIPPGPITDLRLDAANGQYVTLAWTATGDDGATGRASRYDLRYSTAPIDAGNFASATPVTGPPNPLPAGGAETARVGGLAFQTSYWFAVRALDEFGNASPISNVVPGTTLGPPVMAVAPDSLAADLYTGGHETRTLTVTNSGPSDLDFSLSVDEHVAVAAVPAGQRVIAVGHVVPLDRIARTGIAPQVQVGAGSPDKDAVRRPGQVTPASPARVLGTEVFGSMQSAFAAGPRTRGNIFHCTTRTRLEEQRLYLEPSAATRLWFLVYEGMAETGVYQLISASDLSPAGPGAGWYSSGPLDVRLEAGRYYIIAASFEQTSVYYCQQDVSPYPYPASFGELIAGAGWGWAPTSNFPPDSLQLVPAETFGSTVAYYQTLVTRPGPGWLSGSPETGTVPPVSSLDLSILFDAAGMNGGDYLGDVVLGSNDPAHPESRTVSYLHVTGAPDLKPSSRSAAFDSVYTGTVHTDTLIVRNAGTDLLTVTGLAVDASPPFSVEPTGGFALAPGADRPVYVRFAPTDPGPRSATLTITSDDPDEPSLAVALSGIGVSPPDITVSPDSLFADLLTGGRAERVLHVANDGQSALRLKISISESAPAARATIVGRRFGPATARPADEPSAGPRYDAGARPARPVLLPMADRSTSVTGGSLRILLVNNGGDVGEIRGLLAAMPDVAVVDEIVDTVPSLEMLRGYTAAVVSTNSMYYTDPVALGNVLADYVDAGGGVVLTLASFIGGYNVQGRFLSGGYMPYNLGSGPVGSASLGPFDPAHPIMHNVTALWADLLGTATLAPGAQWVASYANGLPLAAVMGRHVAALNVFVGGSGLWTGDVPRLIHNAVAWSGGVRWIAETPDAAVLGPGTALDVAVTFDATDLYGGDYRAALDVASNDPDEAHVVVPAHLHVTGAPDIRVTPAALAYDTVFVGTTRTDSVLVRNVGTDVLEVTGASIAAPSFSVDPAAFTLAPAESRKLAVHFSPGAEGPAAATLQIASNDNDTPVAEVALSGIGLLPPILAIAPDSIGADLFTGGRESRTITIGNTGSSNLAWSIRTTSIPGAPALAGVSRRITPLGAVSATHGSGLPNLPPPMRAPLTATRASRAAAVGSYRVLLLNVGGWDTEIQSLLAAEPGIAVVDEYYSYTAPPLDLLRQYDAAVMISSDTPSGPGSWGDVLADYVDGGGGLVMTVAAFSPCCGISGRLLTGGYFPLRDLTGIWIYGASLGWFDAAHPIMQGVTSVTTSLCAPAALEPGAAAVARFTDSTGTVPLVATKGRVVGMNLYFGYPGYWTGEVPHMLRNAVAWTAGPSWLSAAPTQGIVSPLTQVEVTATFDAARLYGGDYRADLSVLTNDPARPRVDLPAHLHVTGAPDLVVVPRALAFDTVLVGLARAESLVVRNDGTDLLDVTALTLGSSAYTVEPPGPFQLAPTASRTLLVRFAPSAAGTFDTGLTIESNDPDSAATIVPLAGVGLEPPQLTMRPDSLTDSLFTNEVGTRILSIRNTGQSNLRFTITRTRVGAMAGFVPRPPSTNEVVQAGRAPAGYAAIPATPHQMAGARVLLIEDYLPWGFASNEQVLAANGAAYDVIPSWSLASADLSPYRLIILPSDQTTSYYMTLQASRSKLESFVTSGGVLEDHTSFGWQGGDVTQFVLPGGVHVSPYASYWDHVLMPAHPLVAGVPEPFYGNQASLSYLTTVPGNAAQIVSDDQYRPALVVYPLGAGYVIACGPIVEWGYYQGQPAGQILVNMIPYALDLSNVRWLTLTPSEGTVLPGEGLDVTARFDATGLLGGEYRADVHVVSNDPVRPRVDLPARLHVTGVPRNTFWPASLAFDSVLVGVARVETLSVSNVGTDVLHVTGMAPGDPAFSVSPPDTFSLVPGGTRLLHVRFAPTAPGAVNTGLVFTSNDPVDPTPTVPLSGIGVSPPHIVTQPDSLVADLFTNETTSRVLGIDNNGESNLYVRLGRVPIFTSATAAPGPSWASLSTSGSSRQRPDGSTPVAAVPRTTAGSDVLLVEDALPWGVPANEEVLAASGIAYDLANSWSLAGLDLMRYRLIVVAGDQFTSTYANIAAVRAKIDSFVVAGGVLEFHAAGWGWQNGDASLVTLPGGMHTAVYYSTYDHVLMPGHALVAGVPEPFGYWASHGYFTGVPAGADQVAADDNFRSNLVVYTVGRGHVVTGAQTFEFGYGNGYDTGRILRNMIPFSHDLASVKWLTLSPAEATIVPHGHLDVQARFDATGLYGGNYRAEVHAASNDPARPLVVVPARLHVTGRPTISVAPLSLAFGSIFVGAATTDSVVVGNTGTDVLSVSGIATSAPFSAEPATFDLPPGGQRVVHVRFAPESPQVFAGGLAIASNDPLQPTVTVSLAGTGLVPPELGWSPDSLVAALERGQQGDRILHLSNTGGSDLQFTASVIMAGALAQVHPGLDLVKGQTDPRPGILGGGGPDLAGHCWIDSDEPGGPVYEWVDITSTGTVVPMYGDDAAAQIPIGFAFPFYGNTFQSVYVCSNGFLSFTYNTSYSNQPLPSPAAPANLIAPLWDDLYCPSGRVISQSDGSRLVVSYIGVYPLGSGTYYDFQVILHSDGRIRYQYRWATGGWVPSATVGIQNAVGSDGLNIAFDAAYLHDSLAVEIRPSYLTIAPVAGTVPAGGGLDLVAHFDATFVPAGEYRGGIRLATNDPAHASVTVPTHMDVVGRPKICASPAQLDFGQVEIGFAPAESLVVSNCGWAPLTVSGTSVSGAGFSAPAAGFVLAPQESRTLLVTFAPAQPGEVSGSLVLHSDDAQTPDLAVALHGTGLAGPAAVVSPTMFEEELGAGEVRNRDLTIQNTGGMPLHWTIEAQIGVLAVTTAHDPAGAAAARGLREPQAAGGRAGRIADDPDAAARAGQDAPEPAAGSEAATLREATVGQRPAWVAAEAGTAAMPALADVLTNLDLRVAAVTEGIPNRFDFEEGETGNCIYDGGLGMFAVGNILKTDRGTARLPYSNRTLATSGLFGTTPQPYFTAKYPGLFVLAADLLGATSVYTSGTLGADVTGIVDASELAATVNGKAYRGYVKRVYAGGTPSVNHLFIVPWSDSTSHTFSPMAGSDMDRINGLGSSRRIYYLLFGGTDGAYVDDTAMLQIMTSFLSAVEPPGWLSVLPPSGVVPPGGVAHLGVTFDARGKQVGSYEGRLVLTSDDRAHPEVIVPAGLLVTGPTAVLASLLSATAEPGIVRLAWSIAGGGAANVYRTAGADWVRVGTTVAAGDGQAVYEDRTVMPGTRYGYRLGFVQDHGETFAAEAWIEVPRAVSFALKGPKRNPAAGDVAVAFSLPDATAARLELLDVTGRRLDARDVGSLGAGDHEVTLGTGACPPGVYLVRLTRGGRSLTSRVAVIR